MLKETFKIFSFQIFVKGNISKVSRFPHQHIALSLKGQQLLTGGHENSSKFLLLPFSREFILFSRLFLRQQRCNCGNTQKCVHKTNNSQNPHDLSTHDAAQCNTVQTPITIIYLREKFTKLHHFQMSQISVLCATISNQQTDDPPCFPNCSVLSGYSVFMPRIIMGSQWLRGTCHTKFWNRTRNWLFLLMWSTPYNHRAEMTDRLPVAQCQYPRSGLSFDIAKNKPEEILNIPPCRRCQDEANFRKDWGTVVTDKNSILQGHSDAPVTFCSASSMPRILSAP